MNANTIFATIAIIAIIANGLNFFFKFLSSYFTSFLLLIIIPNIYDITIYATHIIITVIPLLFVAFDIQNFEILILVFNFNNVSIVNRTVGARKLVRILATSAPLAFDTSDEINVYTEAIPIILR